MPKQLAYLILLSVLPAGAADADDVGLGSLIPNLYGPAGLFVESEANLPSGETHSAHFNSAFQSEFTQFNIAFASQLTTVPLPSPSSGFTFEFEPSTGSFTRSTRSFGPILADRADTIGRHRLVAGFAVQSFDFDAIEGVDLGDVPAVFTHDGAQLGGGRSDLVTSRNSIDVGVRQFTTFVTYGLTDRIDLSVAVPVVDADLAVVSHTTVQRIGTSDPKVHFFSEADEHHGNERTFTASGSASGLGDLVLRLKSAILNGDHAGFAVGVDARLPTGDEENLLGSGAWGVKPFVVISRRNASFSPHLNLGYQWNGRSVLAGDVRSGTKADIPDYVFYAVGLDVGINDRLSLAVDLLGQRVLDSPRLVRRTFLAANGESFPNIEFEEDSFYQNSAAIGFKVNPWGQLLVDANLLFRLDDGGLRADLTPLVGIEYSF